MHCGCGCGMQQHFEINVGGCSVLVDNKVVAARAGCTTVRCRLAAWFDSRLLQAAIQLSHVPMAWHAALQLLHCQHRTAAAVHC
jgi:hypothetical protein